MSVLESIGGTRLLPLRHLVPEGSARILVKLEYENPTGSMKDVREFYRARGTETVL